MTRRFHLASALAVPALWAGIAGPAHASFTVAPPTAKVERPPGGTAFGSFMFATEGEKDSRFAVDVREVTQSAEGGLAVKPSRSATEWLKVTGRRLRARDGKTQRVTWSLAVPPGAEPGDHVFAIVVRSLPQQKANAPFTPSHAIAHRLTVRVPGALRRDVAIANLTAPKIAGGGAVTATADIVNRGNVSVELGGKDGARFAVVHDGRAAARARVDGTVVPGGTRRVQLTWNDPPRLGKAVVEASVPRAFGGDDRRAEITFVPWREFGALLLLSAALFVLLRLVRTHVRLEVVR